MRLGKKLAYSAVATALTCTLTIAAVEALFGALLRGGSGEPRFPTELAPDVRTKDRGVATVTDPFLGFRVKPLQRSDHLTTNRFGLRGEEIELLPSSGVVRVLFLGGSVAWGYTAHTAEEAIPALLQQALNARLDREPHDGVQRFEVLNGAAPSYVSWQETLLYARHLRRLRPHWIVTLDGVNDVRAALSTRVAGSPMHAMANRGPVFHRRLGLFAAARIWLDHRVAASRTAKWLEQRRQHELTDQSVPDPDNVARLHRDAMAALTDLAARDRASVLCVLQPMLLLPERKSLTDFEEAFRQWYEGTLVGQTHYYIQCYDAMLTALRRLGERRPAFHVHDATDAFADLSELAYYDHCHLTLRGRTALAEHIAERLWQAGIAPTTP